MSIILNGNQLLQAVQMLCPDCVEIQLEAMNDPLVKDQLAQEIGIERWGSDVAEGHPAGMYAHIMEYQEEGYVYLDEPINPTSEVSDG